MSEIEQPENSLFPTEMPEPIPDTEILSEPKKDHDKKSIVFKVQRFQELSELLVEPDYENEVQDLLKDIRSHANWVYEYIEILEDNAERLRERAKMISEAARVQENKAKTYKEYLKTALQVGGFEKFPIGDMVLNLSTVTKYVPKQPATEKDLMINPELVDTKFEWLKEPDVMDWVDNKEKIKRSFEWKLDKIKAEIKACQKVVDSKKSTPEQKDIAASQIDKLSAIVREEYSYTLKITANKV